MVYIASYCEALNQCHQEEIILRSGQRCLNVTEPLNGLHIHRNKSESQRFKEGFERNCLTMCGRTSSERLSQSFAGMGAVEKRREKTALRVDALNSVC